MEDGMGKLRRVRPGRQKGQARGKPDIEPEPFDPATQGLLLDMLRKVMAGKYGELWKQPCFHSCPHYTARRVHRYDSTGKTLTAGGGPG